MKPEDIGRLAFASQPTVSPDGRQVAFTVTRVDRAANDYRSQVWVVPADASRPARPVTGGTQRDANPTWSPDGRLLAFTSHRDGKKTTATVHVMPFDDPGETVTVAVAKGGASQLKWSPDGRWLAFAGDALDARYEEDDPAKQPPRRIARVMYRLDGKGWTHDRPSHVWVVRADGSGTVRDLTPGEFAFSTPSWLADSSGVVCTGKAHDTWDLDFASDLYLVPLAGERRALTDHDGILGNPSVSPDGRRVAFIGYDDPSIGARSGRIGLLSLDTRARRWIDAGLDRTFAPYPSTQPPVWDGESLIVSYEDRGDVLVRRVPLGAAPPATTVSQPQRSVEGFAYANGTLAVAVSRFDSPAELAVIGRDGIEKVLTSVTDELRSAAAPADAHRFTSPSTNGADVDTWVTLPNGVDPNDAGAKLPVLLDVHGGPLSQYGNKFFDEAHLQAGAGYVVVMCNPRGSSGREESWGQSIIGPKHPKQPGRGWGTVDVEDVLAALDEALRRFPCADPDRVGMIGGSYGGYMATWLAGHTNRFKAICSERSVNNMYMEEYTSDIATEFKVETGVDYLEDPEELARMSPISYVRQIETPLLIIHSEDDLRCPISQAEELFVALRVLGKPVEVLRFPAEGHELSRSGSPAHRIMRQEAITEFFDRYLKR